ncbi:MAG: TrmH family RNA methyltransferase [Prevotella sp.]|nr:TrmH family RNA methyltransferase [Prevotella sp.]
MKKTSIIEMNRLSVEEFHEAEKMPLIVVLDDVRSLYNVGSVFRTSDAFRVEAIYLCGITATPDEVRDEDGTLVRDCTLKASQEIHKTALGAEESVAWRYYKTAAEAVAALKADGYTVLAVEQCHGSTMLNDFKPAFGDKKKYAVVLGNEVKGVHQEVVDMCDGCLEIPQYGTKHSLNVSVTAGIVIWHFASSNL